MCVCVCVKGESVDRERGETGEGELSTFLFEGNAGERGRVVDLRERRERSGGEHMILCEGRDGVGRGKCL